MAALLRLSRAIDWICALVGRAVAWLVLAAVLVSAGNAVLRKAIDLNLPPWLIGPYIRSSNSWLELQWYLFSAVFLLAAAWTLQRNEHIRIDIVSSRLSKRTRDWIDLLGHLVMLMPFAWLMLYEGLPYLRTSFAQQERSANAGGLLLWPGKALIVAGFLLLFLQGLSEIIKRIAIMRGDLLDPPTEDQPPPVKAKLSLREPGQ